MWFLHAGRTVTRTEGKGRPVDNTYHQVTLDPSPLPKSLCPWSSRPCGAGAWSTHCPRALRAAASLCCRLGLGQLQPGQRKPRRQLDRHDRRWAGHLVPGGGGHQRRLLGRHPHRRDLRQRSVLPDRGHLHPAQRWSVDRCGGASPKWRPEPLSRSLLLEQRQSRVDAVQADRWQLDPARRVLVPRCAGGRHPVEPLRLRLDALVLPKRCRAHHGHRHQLDRGCAGRDGLRRPTR